MFKKRFYVCFFLLLLSAGVSGCSESQVGSPEVGVRPIETGDAWTFSAVQLSFKKNSCDAVFPKEYFLYGSADVNPTASGKLVSAKWYLDYPTGPFQPEYGSFPDGPLLGFCLLYYRVDEFPAIDSALTLTTAQQINRKSSSDFVTVLNRDEVLNYYLVPNNAGQYFSESGLTIPSLSE